MKILSERNVKGKRRVIVELDKGEELLALQDNVHYRLGAQIDDVVPGHALGDAVPVMWCPHEQKWRE